MTTVRITLPGCCAVLALAGCGMADPVGLSDPGQHLSVDVVPQQGPLASQQAEERDRAALVALYEATGGENWSKRDNWLTDAPLDDWHGVRFGQYNQGYGRVTGLYLAGNKLRGDIPPEIAQLDSLYDLHLYDNRLTGPIPPELGDMGALEEILLYDNRLRGAIPKELGKLTRLQYLALDQNRLSGPIPTELGNLERLRALELYRNRLTGSIPAELGRLVGLWTLKLQRNRLSGSVPEELSELTRLRTLRLDRNRFTGRLPEAFPGGLRKLRRFHFQRQDLCAPNTTEFVEWFEWVVPDVKGPFCAEAVDFSGGIKGGRSTPRQSASALHRVAWLSHPKSGSIQPLGGPDWLPVPGRQRDTPPGRS